MGQSGDASAQQPQVPAAPAGDKQPMIEQDVTPASADDHAIADESAPEDATEDVTTQIVPQSALTPPSPTPPRPGGSPQPAGSLAGAPPPYQAYLAAGAAAPHQEMPNAAPVMGGQRPAMPGSAINAPWHTASSWGATTFVITAETAAGFSYLFWWISGLLVYFNERENRYVRFHAVQSILLTGALSVFGVFAFTIAAIFNDLFQSSHQHFWQTLCVGTVALALLIVALPWLGAMIAAWTGTYLQLPIVGDYAERFAAPPIQLRP